MNLKTKLNSTIKSQIIRLFWHVSPRRRRQFIILLGLTLLSSFAEVISLGALVPFMGVLTQPDKVFHYLEMKGILGYFGITTSSELVLPLTACFGVAALGAGTLRLLLSWVSIKLTNGIGIDLSTDVYRRTLFQPYLVHVGRSSSEIISGITQKIGSATSMLLSLMNLLTSSLLFFSILVTLIFIDPIIAGSTMLSFGACYALIAWKTKKRIFQNGKFISSEQTNVLKALQEGLGAIREVLLDGTQEIYCNQYKKSYTKLQNAGGENNFINQAPRFVMESIGMVLIAFLAYALSYREGGIHAAIPILGALALGAQKLLPLLQILYANWAGVLGGQASLEIVLDLLEQPLPSDSFLPLPAPLAFQKQIRFENVRFNYDKLGPWILDGINLIIPKGTRVGFIGSTGSGKSTTLDLLMQLLDPVEGKIFVDDQVLNSEVRRSWQRSIAHVPQNIYLADSTIAENIAFGVSSDMIDMERVKLAAKQAQIAEFIESSTENYNAIVGERGVRLSGGQRQRIGIARALYKQATLLIFDEATSALDNGTEKAVMASIENLNRDLTILMIAHRFTTLEHCDHIVRLEKGKLVEQGTYQYFLKNGFNFESTVVIDP